MRNAAIGTLLLVMTIAGAQGEEKAKAVITGAEPGWRDLREDEFTGVNCEEGTFVWREDGVIACSGKPVGVIRTKKDFTNFELVLEWRHLKKAGNSGVFLWTMPESIIALEKGKGRLPQGIEVQILDLAYKENYEKDGKKKADWFTCHGDVFSVGAATMTPFAPISPNGRRSFPTAETTKGVGEWNHYYIRAINGEVRLWVNGVEVSGGSNCVPATGSLCLESEGSPLEFRHLRIRELP